MAVVYSATAKTARMTAVRDTIDAGTGPGVLQIGTAGMVTGGDPTPAPPETPAQGGGRPWRFVASVPIPLRPRRRRRRREEELALI